MIGHVGKNRWTSIFGSQWSDQSLFLDCQAKNRNNQILLALSNIWTLSIILLSWCTSVRATDVALAAEKRNHMVSYVLVELLHGGLQLELMHVSSVELDVELMELCSV